MAKLCHSGPKFVMRLGKASIYAGTKDEVMAEQGWALALSALGVPTQTSPISANQEAAAILPKELGEWTPVPILGIDWPDRGVPRLSRQWWVTLVEFLKTVEGDVAVFCFGGHGRTGTMLSILGVLGGAIPQKKDPVAWIRTHYCTQAVESVDQIEYIERVTKRQVKAQGSDSFYVRPSSGQGYGGAHQSGLPFPASTQVPNTAASYHGGANTTIEPDGVREVLYRFEDEYGPFWTDAQGNIVATAYDPDELEDDAEEEASPPALTSGEAGVMARIAERLQQRAEEMDAAAAAAEGSEKL